MKGQAFVDTTDFNRALLQLAQATKKPLRKVVDQNAKLLAINLAFQTQPYGNSLDAKKLGETAVLNDIGKVYKTAAKTYEEIRKQSEDQAKGFYKAVKTGNYKLAESILRRSGADDKFAEVGELDKELHGKYKNKKGRVNRRRAAQIVSNAGELKAYAKEVKKRVGYAKSGWIVAASQLGRLSRVPRWIKKPGSHGKAIKQGGDKNPSVNLHNDVPYVSDVLTDKEADQALRIQTEKMTEHINYVLAYHAKKAGFRVSGNQGQPAPEP